MQIVSTLSWTKIFNFESVFTEKNFKDHFSFWNHHFYIFYYFSVSPDAIAIFMLKQNVFYCLHSPSDPDVLLLYLE